MLCTGCFIYTPVSAETVAIKLFYHVLVSVFVSSPASGRLVLRYVYMVFVISLMCVKYE